MTLAIGKVTSILTLISASIFTTCAMARDELPFRTEDTAAPLAVAQPDSITITGIMRSYTFAADGEVSGLLLEDDSRVWFPAHLGRQVAAVVSGGANVQVTGQRRANSAGELGLAAEVITNLDDGVALLLNTTAAVSSSSADAPPSGAPIAPAPDAVSLPPPATENTAPLPPAGGALILPEE